MAKKSVINWIALVLLIIGGLNWGLIGIFDVNLLEEFLSPYNPLIQRGFYMLLGAAAGYIIYRDTKETEEKEW